MTRLRRKIDDFLIEWKNSENKLPLIVKGARQVGKTDAIENFARNNYENIVEINFALESEYKGIFDNGFKVDTIVLEKKMVTPNKEVAEILNIPITSQVMFLKRLRKVHENPIVVQESYLSSKVSEKLFNVDYNQYSLYDSLKEICKTEIVMAKDTVEAKAATGEVCDWLEAEEGFPVLVARRVAYDVENDPIELSNSIYRSDQYVLEIEYK